jgi:hypothetical protein
MGSPSRLDYFVANIVLAFGFSQQKVEGVQNERIQRTLRLGLDKYLT